MGVGPGHICMYCVEAETGASYRQPVLDTWNFAVLPMQASSPAKIYMCSLQWRHRQSERCTLHAGSSHCHVEKRSSLTKFPTTLHLGKERIAVPEICEVVQGCTSSSCIEQLLGRKHFLQKSMSSLQGPSWFLQPSLLPQCGSKLNDIDIQFDPITPEANTLSRERASQQRRQESKECHRQVLVVVLCS